jgi:hypothetical protein
MREMPQLSTSSKYWRGGEMKLMALPIQSSNLLCSSARAHVVAKKCPAFNAVNSVVSAAHAVEI